MDAPATFRRALDIILNKYTPESCLVCLNDITMFSESSDQHHEDTENILSVLQTASVSLKLQKCHWSTTEVKCYGQNITPYRLSITETHTKARRELEHPRNLLELCSFLRMFNVYRRFVSHYSRIAAPLNQLFEECQPYNSPPDLLIKSTRSKC